MTSAEHVSGAGEAYTGVGSLETGRGDTVPCDQLTEMNNWTDLGSFAVSYAALDGSDIGPEEPPLCEIRERVRNSAHADWDELVSSREIADLKQMGEWSGEQLRKHYSNLQALTERGRDLCRLFVQGTSSFLRNATGALESLALLNPELAPIIGQVWGATRQELIEVVPSAEDVVTLAEFGLLGKAAWNLAVSNRYIIRIASEELWKRAASSAAANSIRVASQQGLSRAGALVRLGYYSAINGYYSTLERIATSRGALQSALTSAGRSLIRPVALPVGSVSSNLIGGAVLAAPAVVYAGFQKEYYEIRMQHAQSTGDCLDLAQPLHWRQRMQCEKLYSNDESTRLACLDKARSIYSRELKACMDQFQSGFYQLLELF